MILGASHMTLACEDIDTGLASLASLGYSAEFIERGLKNAPVKTPFLSRPYDRHDLAFTRCPGGLPIELMRYDGAAPGGRGEFQAYFARPAILPKHDAASLAAPLFLRSAGASDRSRCHDLAAFRTSAIFDPAAAVTGGLTMAGLTTSDLTASRRFWTDGLGYTLEAEQDTWCKLSFRSPVAAWTFTVVVAAGEPSPGQVMLDSVGWTCFSHLSSALDKDRRRLLEAGATATSGPFEMRINGKLLRVEILRGPSGELIELLQVAGQGERF